jgi:5-methylthioadenosine/S-adenosylhomocysteine deaminase
MRRSTAPKRFAATARRLAETGQGGRHHHLDATALSVAPLNEAPRAVVSLMDRTNVETVIVARKIRRWKGKLLDADLPKLRGELEASRDAIFATAQIKPDLFRSN